VKIAVLTLVLANLVLFAWLRWAVGASPNEPLTPVTRTARQVVLLSGMPATATRPTTVAAPWPDTRFTPSVATVATQHPGGKPQCLVWGPLAATAATQLATKLKESDASVQSFTRPVEMTVSYRVELTGFVDLDAAKRVESAIRKGGVTDLYILDKSDERQPVLSLGLFHERSGARQRAARARKLGFQPIIRVIKRKGPYHFLQLRLPVAASAIAAFREQAMGDEPRHAACISPPVTATAPVEASAP